MTTNKQADANKRNAKKSTGPKSTEGKERSSRNAVKHSAYAEELYPLARGPLAENPEEFRGRAEELLRGFDPQDPLEAELAKRGTKALMTLQRLDRFESMLVDQEGVLDPLAATTVGDPCQTDGDLLTAERLVTLVEIDKDMEVPTDAGLQSDDFDYMPEDWEAVARLARAFCPDPDRTVKDLWNSEREPSTPAEWAAAARTIWTHFWPEHDDRVNWARGVESAVNIVNETTMSKTNAVLVRRILNSAMEPLERPRAQAWKELKEAVGHLERMRALRNRGED